jgi:hypothetical protein
MILDSRRSSYYSDNKNEETKLFVDDAIDKSSRKSLRLSIGLPPPTKSENIPTSQHFAGRNMEENHFGSIDPGDGSTRSESVLSKGLYGGSPQHFERNIPVCFGGSKHKKSVPSKGLYGGNPQHFERTIPVYFGGSKHKKSVPSKGLNSGSPHFRRNIPVYFGGRSPHFGRNMKEDHFGPADRGGRMHSESVLSKGLYGDMHQ